MNLETKIIIYKFTPQVFTLTHKRKSFIFHEINIYLWNIYREFIPTFCLYLQSHEI